MKKAFTDGQTVQFQRDTSPGRAWETGKYKQASHHAGWHFVTRDDGSVAQVPSRRIRSVVEARAGFDERNPPGRAR